MMRSRMTGLVLLAAVATATVLAVARASTDGGGSGPELGPSFTVGTLDVDLPGGQLTSAAFGPDGRLYVATAHGHITALTLDSTGTQVVDSEVIAESTFVVVGIAFEPTAPPEPVVVYASGRDFSGQAGLAGIVSTFAAPDWTREDIITGLTATVPLDHGTNGIAFDDSGRLLIGQGFGPTETSISGAVLVADIHDPFFDGHMTYRSYREGFYEYVDVVSGDVRVFASGFRNPYDLVLHSNGNIYATDNGGTGPDEVNLIEEGQYYGYPNTNRGRTDPRQLAFYPGQEPSSDEYTAPILTAYEGCYVCEGIAEYTSDEFDGLMEGDLLSVGYWAGDVWRLDLSDDGTDITTASIIGTLHGALDMAVGSTGIIYGGLSYLKPNGLAPVTPTPTPYPTWTPAPTVPTATFVPPPTARFPTATPTRTPTPTRTLRPSGDANCDGVTDSRDAALVLQVTANLIGNVPCPVAADLDGNRRIDSVDALLILQCSAGLRAC